MVVVIDKNKKSRKKPAFWDKLSSRQRCEIIAYNRLNKKRNEGPYMKFPRFSFVIHKSDKLQIVRFVSKSTGIFFFEDDGKLSGHSPNKHCKVVDYLLIDTYPKMKEEAFKRRGAIQFVEIKKCPNCDSELEHCSTGSYCTICNFETEDIY